MVVGKTLKRNYMLDFTLILDAIIFARVALSMEPAFVFK
jgi:hypothetical protein